MEIQTVIDTIGMQENEKPHVQEIVIDEHAIYVNVTLGQYGQRRTIGEVEITTRAKRTEVSARKVLFRSKKYKAIATTYTKIRKLLDDYCLPSTRGGGVHILPYAILEQFHNEMTALVDEAQDRIIDFVEEWPLIVEQAKVDLQELFNPNDYPEPEALRTRFMVDFEYFTYNQGDLQFTSQKAYEYQVGQVKIKTEETIQKIEEALCSGFSELVKSMTWHLTPKEDGGAEKKYYKSKIQQLEEFISLFQHRNLTQNEELEILVQKAGNLLQGVEPEDIKQSDSLAHHLKVEFGHIQQSLEQFSYKQRRQYSLEED
jgi:hypothetical protein